MILKKRGRFFFFNKSQETVYCMLECCLLIFAKENDRSALDWSTKHLSSTTDVQHPKFEQKFEAIFKKKKKLNKKNLPWQVTYAFESSSVHKLAL